jgi:hypothetical protein
MEGDDFQAIVSEHRSEILEAWGCPRGFEPGEKNAAKYRHRFWDFFKSVIVPMDKIDKSKLHEDAIIEKYRNQLYSKPHTFYAVGLREELLVFFGKRHAKLNPRDVENLMFDIAKQPNHPFFYVAIYYLTELSNKYMSPLAKVYGSREYSRDDALKANFWKQFAKDVKQEN